MIGKKIREVRIKSGFSQAEIAEILSITPITQSNYEQEKRMPSYEYVGKLAKATNASIEWFYDSANNKQMFKDNDKKTLKDLAQTDHASLPLYEVRVSAGFGALNNSQNIKEYLSFGLAWMNEQGLQSGASIAIVVDGESMQPAIKAGDIVAFNQSEGYIGEGVYVFRLGDELMVKRLLRVASHKLLVQSENEAYPSFELDLKKEEGFEVLGKVRAIVKPHSNIA